MCTVLGQDSCFFFLLVLSACIPIISMAKIGHDEDRSFLPPEFLGTSPNLRRTATTTVTTWTGAVTGLMDAMLTDAVVDFGSSITATSNGAPKTMTGLTINGNRDLGFFLSGANQYQCFNFGSSASVTINDLTIQECVSSSSNFDGGGAFLVFGSAVVTLVGSYVDSSNDGNYPGHFLSLSDTAVVNLVGCSVQADIQKLGGTINTYSLCGAGFFQAGVGTVACQTSYPSSSPACAPPITADLSSSSCSLCAAADPLKPYACCGATACSAVPVSCSLLEGTFCPDPTAAPSRQPSPLPSLVPTAPTPTPTASPTAHCGPGTYLLETSDGGGGGGGGAAAAGVCTECPIGQFSNSSAPPFPRACAPCEAGRYNTATGRNKCLDCPSGKLSSEDRSFCKDCQAGEYSYQNLECKRCEYGKYAPQAFTESCLTCSLGSATNGNRNATSCTACDAGSFSGSLPTSRCLLCATGQWAPSGQQACSLCEAGSFADLEGASVCTKCAAGYATAVVAAAQGGAEAATPYLGSVACQECVVGRFQGRTGATLCQECEAGKFASASLSKYCVECGAGHWSGAASSQCSLCARNYFDRGGGSGGLAVARCTRCEKKFIGVDCEKSIASSRGGGGGDDAAAVAGGTSGGGAELLSLTLKPGYWRVAAWSDQVLKCPGPMESAQKVCVGGADAGDYCTEGHQGPYCSLCSSDFYQWDGLCFHCFSSNDDNGSPGGDQESGKGDKEAAGALVPLLAGCSGVLLLVLLFVIFGFEHDDDDDDDSDDDEGDGGGAEDKDGHKKWAAAASAAASAVSRSLRRALKRSRSRLLPLLKVLTLPPLTARRVRVVAKTSFVTLQILVLLPVVLDLEFPEPFPTLLGYVGVVTVNFDALTTGLECYVPTAASFYWYLVAVTLIPVAIAAALTLFGLRSPRHRDRCFYWVIFLAFAMLPIASVACFRVFPCEEFDGGSRYLKADFHINCDTTAQTLFQAYGGVMIAVWPLGVPCLFATLLWKHRHALSSQPQSSSSSSFDYPHHQHRPLAVAAGQPPYPSFETSQQEASPAQDGNGNGPSHNDGAALDGFRILFEGYQPALYFWEIISTSRRLFLIAALVVVAQGAPVAQLSVGLFACLLFLTLHARYFPFQEPFENAFALACEWVVFLAMFLALIGRMDPASFEGSRGRVVGVTLTAATLAMLVLSAVFMQFEVGKAVVVTVTLNLASAHHASLPRLTMEDAHSFTASKFVTTLAAVGHNHVSRANVLVYLYCSMATAKRVRETGGIPVLADIHASHRRRRQRQRQRRQRQQGKQRTNSAEGTYDDNDSEKGEDEDDKDGSDDNGAGCIRAFGALGGGAAPSNMHQEGAEEGVVFSLRGPHELIAARNQRDHDHDQKHKYDSRKEGGDDLVKLPEDDDNAGNNDESGSDDSVDDGDAGAELDAIHPNAETSASESATTGSTGEGRRRRMARRGGCRERSFPEVVLVCSLPRWLLRPLSTPNHEDSNPPRHPHSLSFSSVMSSAATSTSTPNAQNSTLWYVSGSHIRTLGGVTTSTSANNDNDNAGVTGNLSSSSRVSSSSSSSTMQPISETDTERNSMSGGVVNRAAKSHSLPETLERGSSSSMFSRRNRTTSVPTNYSVDEHGDHATTHRPLLLLPAACVVRSFQLIKGDDLKAPPLHQSVLATTTISTTTAAAGGQVRQSANNDGKGGVDNDEGLSALPPTITATTTTATVGGTATAPDTSAATLDAAPSPPSMAAVAPCTVASAVDVARRMASVRKACSARGLVPVYHYTSPAVAPLILAHGFKMSTQGQGDGGVYTSTLGPCSYGLGTQGFEDRIIADCFGAERLHEYRGQGKLDACLVLGVDPSLLVQAPGGRANARMVPKTAFLTLATPRALPPPQSSSSSSAAVPSQRSLSSSAASSTPLPFLSPTSALPPTPSSSSSSSSSTVEEEAYFLPPAVIEACFILSHHSGEGRDSGVGDDSGQQRAMEASRDRAVKRHIRAAEIKVARCQELISRVASARREEVYGSGAVLAGGGEEEGGGEEGARLRKQKKLQQRHIHHAGTSSASPASSSSVGTDGSTGRRALRRLTRSFGHSSKDSASGSMDDSGDVDVGDGGEEEDGGGGAFFGVVEGKDGGGVELTGQRDFPHRRRTRGNIGGIGGGVGWLLSASGGNNNNSKESPTTSPGRAEKSPGSSKSPRESALVDLSSVFGNSSSPKTSVALRPSNNPMMAPLSLFQEEGEEEDPTRAVLAIDDESSSSSGGGVGGGGGRTARALTMDTQPGAVLAAMAARQKNSERDRHARLRQEQQRGRASSAATATSRHCEEGAVGGQGGAVVVDVSSSGGEGEGRAARSLTVGGASAAAPAHTLPPQAEWQKLEDAEGRSYYHNVSAGSTQWEAPEGWSEGPMQQLGATGDSPIGADL